MISNTQCWKHDIRAPGQKHISYVKLYIPSIIGLQELKPPTNRTILLTRQLRCHAKFLPKITEQCKSIKNTNDFKLTCDSWQVLELQYIKNITQLLQILLHCHNMDINKTNSIPTKTTSFRTARDVCCQSACVDALWHELAYDSPRCTCVTVQGWKVSGQSTELLLKLISTT